MNDQTIKATALIVAAGKSERFGDHVPKQFHELRGRPLLAWTISRFEAAEAIDSIVLVVAEEEMEQVAAEIVDEYDYAKVAKIVAGGKTRQESVRLGLRAIEASARLVAIHDGARPLIRPDDIDRVVTTAARERAAMIGVQVTDTVKRVEESKVVATLDRSWLYLAQTPQVFEAELIRSAHEEMKNEEGITDDASLVERMNVDVMVVEPTGSNIKVTHPDDMIIAEAILDREAHD